jgi:drug/metabolite transporter (DMT)-like permease
MTATAAPHAAVSGPTWLGPACAISTAVIYGTSWVAMGIALESFTPFVAAFWRSIVTVLVLAPLIVRGFDRSLPWTRPRVGRLLVLGLLGGALFGVGSNLAVHLTGAAIAALVTGSYPVVAVALAPLVLHERLRPAGIGGIALAFVGTVLIAGVDLGGAQLAGILIGAVTSLGVGCFLVLSRRWSAPLRLAPTLVSFAMFSTLAVVAGVIAVGIRDPFFPTGATSSSIAALFYLGIFAGALAGVLLTESVRRLPAQESSAYLLLNPLTGALLAIPILGETLAPLQVLGGTFVIAGVALATGGVALIARKLGLARALRPSRTLDAP